MGLGGSELYGKPNMRTAKLTLAQAQSILDAETDEAARELCDTYKIARGMAYQIRKRIRWKHLVRKQQNTLDVRN